MQQENHKLSLSPKGSEPLEIAYYEYGKGEKVVVCVHGLTRNARDFDFLAERLANNGYRVLCLDMPGRGGSSRLSNPADYNYPNYAAIVAEFLKQNGFSEVHWVGTSMGGLIGMVLSAMNPGLISRMVINDIGPFIPAAALDRLASYVGLKTSFATFDEYERELKTILAGFGIKNPEHWQHILKHSAKQIEGGGYEMLYDPAIAHIFKGENGLPKKMEDADLWKVWSAIKHDVLVLRGSKSDLFTRDTAEKMLATHPRAKLIEYEGIGHAPSLMEEHQIKDVISFLS